MLNCYSIVQMVILINEWHLLPDVSEHYLFCSCCLMIDLISSLEDTVRSELGLIEECAVLGILQENPCSR